MSVEDFLQGHGITFTSHRHAPVYTCEELFKHFNGISALACKNLFLKSNKTGRYFLAILPCSRRADLKKIGELTGEGKMSFGHAEALRMKLGVDAGSVGPFGLINNAEHDVTVLVDREVAQAEAVSFHPNINTVSLVLSGEMFKRYLEVLNNVSRVVSL